MSERAPIDWDRVRTDAKYLGDCLFTRAGDGRDDPIFLLLVGVATAWLWRSTPPTPPLDAGCDFQIGPLGGDRAWCESPVTAKCVCRRCLREPEVSDRFHACANHEREVSELHQHVRGVDAKWSSIDAAQNRAAVSQENAPPAAAENPANGEPKTQTLLSQADLAFLEGSPAEHRTHRAFERLCWEVRLLEKSIEVVDVNLETFFELIKGVHAVADLVRQFGMGGTSL